MILLLADMKKCQKSTWSSSFSKHLEMLSVVTEVLYTFTAIMHPQWSLLQIGILLHLPKQKAVEISGILSWLVELSFLYIYQLIIIVTIIVIITIIIIIITTTITNVITMHSRPEQCQGQCLGRRRRQTADRCDRSQNSFLFSSSLILASFTLSSLISLSFMLSWFISSSFMLSSSEIRNFTERPNIILSTLFPSQSWDKGN